ncbi:hypothetical protein ACIBIZ_15065 [Nonomuraea spiralis]|uniref:hypothetical protein n=1 Tax=Nonomuraea TaxID=83681 RepID=UPI000F770335|nr:hypothetical protein [Nonomuraea sp. WAC 01424]RSN11409.1 hypothetical protein DMB42_12460 [Nonomuraea sp. WAC 01424]
MATVMVNEGRVTIGLGRWERLLAGRGGYVFPLEAVREVRVAGEPLRVPRGARRGLAVTGHTKIGVWGLYGGPRQLVSVTRDVPAVHLLLDRAAAGGEFDEVVISLPDAARVAATLRAVVA